MILIRKMSTGEQYVHTVEDVYHTTTESLPTKRESRAWRFAPKRGDGSKSLNRIRGIAALADTYHAALRMIKDLEKMQ